MHHFHKQLNIHLKGKNLSKISRELGIPSTLLFEWKQAKRFPSFKNLIYVQRIATYINLSIEDLLFPTSMANKQDIETYEGVISNLDNSFLIKVTIRKM